MYRPQGYGPGNRQVRFGGPITPAVKILLITNIAVFLFTFIPNLVSSGNSPAVSYIYSYLGITPALFWSQFTLWMPITYLFLHGGLFHLLFNMFALWMFGGEVENVFKTPQFVIYYFFCGIGAGLLVAIIQPGMPIPTIGASGAIYGVLLAYGLFFPERILYINLIFPIKAKYFVLIMVVIVFLSSMGSSTDGISHMAHLGGLVFGFLYIKRNKILQFFGRLNSQRKQKSKVIKMEKIRKMFEEDEDDYRVH